MQSREFKPLLAVAESYILDCCPSISSDCLASLKQIMEHYIADVITFERAAALFLEKVHTSRPIERIWAILNVPENPIHLQSLPQFQVSCCQFARRKTRPWSEYEDQRLLCAVHKFGLDNWFFVSQFVGSQRTRSQCSQRWFRGLDPRISKVLWTDAEEQNLLALVQQYGDRAWTRISAELGNRSDAQCRYHYRQLVKDNPEPPPLPPPAPPPPPPPPPPAIAGIAKAFSAPTKKLQSEVKAIVSSTSAGGEQKKLVLPPILDMIGKALPTFGRLPFGNKPDG
jgi:hypothetical protein